MKKLSINKEQLQFIGGAIVVGAAALIVFPGFLGMFWGLVRILLMLVVAGGACLLLAHGTRRIMKLKGPSASAQAQPSAVIATNPPSPGNTDTQNQAGA